MKNQISEVNQSTSTGHNLGGAAHLDHHYLAAQSEYEETLRSVGLKTGWHVLDAGCGNGVFLPLMSEIVGNTGKISAIDLAPENIHAAEARKLVCPVETNVGSVTSLPFENNQFDAVWSANVTQYLTGDELKQALAECYRVVRPGGIVAVKEVDISVWQFQPLEAMLMWHLIEALQDTTQFSGAMRGTRLPTCLREIGLHKIWRKTTIIERWSPLEPVERDYVSNNLEFLSNLAVNLDLPTDDIAAWKELGKAPEQLMNHVDFCYREMYILAVGQVPSENLVSHVPAPL